MANEYIKRESAIDSLLDWQGSCMTSAEEWHIRQVIRDIKSIPAADVRPVVRGVLVEDERTYPGPGLSNYKCSACEKIAGTWRSGLKRERLYNFCPNCGADMREANDEH